MCIAYLALGAHADWPLFIAANRDEYHARPTRMAAPWPQATHIISGTDLQAGGTWLGVDHFGRFALLTNYREPSTRNEHAPSRGDLVSRYLGGTDHAQDYLRTITPSADSYNGFNLIAGRGNQAFYLGNRAPGKPVQALENGRYVVSNHLLDTPWPKSERLRVALDAFPSENLESKLDDIFDALKDTTQAHDHDLPDTGLPNDRERLLSSPFIVSPNYGTRCSTVIGLHASGKGFLAEISYNPDGQLTGRCEWPFQWVP